MPTDGQEKSPPDIDLGSIQLEDKQPPDALDPKTKQEQDDYDRAAKEAHVRGLNQDIDERKTYAGKIYLLVERWLIGVGVLLVLSGLFAPWRLFVLPNSVLLAIVGGTTVNVLGLFVIVANYLFPKRK